MILLASASVGIAPGGREVERIKDQGIPRPYGHSIEPSSVTAAHIDLARSGLHNSVR